ncbi:MAG: DNA recombination protein RmuC, partial [Chitinophagaceae bacterium]
SMSLEIVLLVTIAVLCIVIAVFSLKTFASKDPKRSIQLIYKLDTLARDVERIESSVKDQLRNEGKSSRDILSTSVETFGNLISKSVKDVGDSQNNQLEAFATNLNTLTQAMQQKLTDLINSMEIKLNDLNTGTIQTAKDNREELRTTIDIMRKTVETKISELQQGNEKKLDEMRATVDEKLQKTLESRLGESFKLVSERLESVHKGLGDMQQLATGVGDLKKVLNNVKTRGVMGEYQLENLLEQMLTPDQYGKNVRTKQGSNAAVEFAVKLPAGENKDQMLWVPIDSKFPKEDFELLMESYEHGNAEQIEERRKIFVRGIRKCANDICGKYIDPPNTTDFAILFLPFESLYAEVLRTPGLFETIKRECSIVISGPTTLQAFLSSLQMGFRTLAIQKRSSEVWNLLAAVKTEFGNFGEILDKTQKKLQEASNVIDQAGVRSRAIERKLKDVQELPENATSIKFANRQTLINIAEEISDVKTEDMNFK